MLHVTNAGRLFINDEEEEWGNLAGRLSEIYSVRAYRKLDLLVDKELSFQTVADVIDIVAGAENPARTEPLNIEVRLITPGALNDGCVAVPLRFLPVRRSWRRIRSQSHQPVADASGRHGDGGASDSKLMNSRWGGLVTAKALWPRKP